MSGRTDFCIDISDIKFFFLLTSKYSTRNSYVSIKFESVYIINGKDFPKNAVCFKIYFVSTFKKLK